MSGEQKVQLYFCRHAESRHNAYGESTTDVDLSELGEQQARSLIGQFDLVLCSPMRRARRTLELSSIRYARLVTVPELREWIYDGSDRLPGEPASLRESQRDVTKRCVAVRDRLRALLSEGGPRDGDDLGRVLLLSHGILGDVLYSLCGTAPPSYIDNAVIYPFAFAS